MPSDAFDPAAQYLFLADGGRALDLPEPDQLWRELEGQAPVSDAARPVAEDGGWLFSGYELSADMDHWEMHPEGNEVLYVVSGAMDLVIEEGSGDRTIALTAGTACLIPQGAWHRQIVRAPGRYLAITYGRGTQHRPFEG